MAEASASRLHALAESEAHVAPAALLLRVAARLLHGTRGALTLPAARSKLARGHGPLGASLESMLRKMQPRQGLLHLRQALCWRRLPGPTQAGASDRAEGHVRAQRARRVHAPRVRAARGTRRWSRRRDGPVVEGAIAELPIAVWRPALATVVAIVGSARAAVVAIRVVVEGLVLAVGDGTLADILDPLEGARPRRHRLLLRIGRRDQRRDRGAAPRADALPARIGRPPHAARLPDLAICLAPVEREALERPRRRALQRGDQVVDRPQLAGVGRVAPAHRLHGPDRKLRHLPDRTPSVDVCPGPDDPAGVQSGLIARRGEDLVQPTRLPFLLGQMIGERTGQHRQHEHRAVVGHLVSGRPHPPRRAARARRRHRVRVMLDDMPALRTALARPRVNPVRAHRLHRRAHREILAATLADVLRPPERRYDCPLVEGRAHVHPTAKLGESVCNDSCQVPRRLRHVLHAFAVRDADAPRHGAICARENNETHLTFGETRVPRSESVDIKDGLPLPPSRDDAAMPHHLEPRRPVVVWNHSQSPHARRHAAIGHLLLNPPKSRAHCTIGGVRPEAPTGRRARLHLLRDLSLGPNEIGEGAPPLLDVSEDRRPQTCAWLLHRVAP